MEMIWMLHGDVLARLRRTLQPSTAVGGLDDAQARVSLDAFVTGIYRALYLEGNSEDRPGGANTKSLLQIQHLAERMCILFDLVDVDDVGVVDWVDFTDFCVYIRGRGIIGHGNRRGTSCEGEHDQQDDIPRYFQNLHYIDRGSHHEIRGMRFAEKLGLLAVVEGTHLLKIYAAGPQRVAQIEPAIEMVKMISDKKMQSAHRRSASKRKNRLEGAQKTESTVTTAGDRKESMAVQAAEFIGCESQIAVSCADGFLTIWELKTCKILRYARMKSIQMGLRFCPAMGVLTSWGIDDSNHDVLVWDVKTLKVIHSLSGHSGPIKDVCEVASSDANETPFNPMIVSSWLGHDDTIRCLHDRATASVTASMDSKVITWDLWLDANGGQRAPKKAFILTGHNHGILSLAYSDEHELLISAGFDVRANCWDRCANHIRMRLVGHRVSLIGAAIVRQEAQCAVTGDEGGNFRLWDIRRGPYDHGICLQTFSLDNARAVPRTMVVAWRGGLIAADSKLYLFRAERHVAARVTPRGAWFSPYTGELFVLLREAVVLDARTGEVRRRICRQTLGREITAFCLNSRGKKALIGDQRGDLRVYDALTGRWAVSAVPHRAEITALLFVDEDDAFVSAGWDRKIQVHDARVCSGRRVHRWTQRSPVASTEHTSYGHRRVGVLRSVKDAHDGDITLMAASFRLGLLVTASTDLTVRVWDYNLLRLEDVIIGHRREISCVCFLDPLPCLATADMAGKILLWAIGHPYEKAMVLLATTRNTIVAVKHKILPSPITALAFLYNKTAPDETTVVRHDLQKVNGVGSPRKGDKDRVESHPSARISGGSRNWKSSSTQMRSTLFAGDEFGSIKAWDVTDILLEKLGHAAFGPEFIVDKAMIPPTAGGKNSHQFVHYRQGPLDGVGMQDALRMRELIDIAKVLRRGDYTPSTTETPGAGSKKGHGSSRADPNDDIRPTRNSIPAHARPSTRGQATNVPGEGIYNLAVSLRSGENGNHADKPVGGGSAKSYPFSVSSEENKTGRQGMGKQAGPREQVEVVLNTPVENFEPVASWRGHTDAVTSIQVILSPPSLLTGSLDSSVRIFDLNGSLLGVVIHENEPGSAPWLFRPTTIGREAEARERAAGFVEKLRGLRRIHQESVRRQDTAGDWVVSADSRGLSADNDSRGLLPVSGSTQTYPTVSATNLSRVKEVTKTRVTMMPDDSETVSAADQVSIGAKLKDEAGGGKSFRASTDQEQKSTSLAQRGRDRLGKETVRNPPKIVKEQLSDLRKTAPNLYMEQQRKHAKRTRSTLQLLSKSLSGTESLPSAAGCLRPSTAPNPKKKVIRARAALSQGKADSFTRPNTAPSTQGEKAKDWSRKEEPRRDLTSVRSAGAFSSTPSLRDEWTTLAPTRTLRLVDEAASQLLLRSKVSKQTLPHHRSAMAFWLASARSNLSNKNEIAKRRTADRRRRRIDGILDGVCQLGKDEFPIPPISSGNDDGSRAPGTEVSQARADAGEGGRRSGAANVVTSTRVLRILSRFETFVSEDVGNPNASTSVPDRQTQDNGYSNPGYRKHDDSSKEASRHNRWYLRAHRLNPVSSQEEAHQSRQEVTLGLTRPSGERFGMYTLHEVLEFQAFAQFLSSQRADHLTVQELMDNPGVQADPRHYAFLQELARTRVLPLNQTMSQEDLMQLVFHSAKREEIRRMISVIDIANMLHRLRDALVVAKEPLLSDDGTLSHCLVNDIETAIGQTANAETCTLRELHGIMTRVGSDLFSLGQEEFEAMAARCGVLDV